MFYTSTVGKVDLTPFAEISIVAQRKHCLNSNFSIYGQDIIVYNYERIISKYISNLKKKNMPQNLNNAFFWSTLYAQMHSILYKTWTCVNHVLQERASVYLRVVK